MIWNITILKNGIINFWLIIILVLIFHFSKDDFVNNIAIGILGSTFAAFNLIDGYNQYKVRNAKIIIISTLKTNTNDFLEKLLFHVENIFKNEAKIEENQEIEKIAWEIINLKMEIWANYNNLSQLVINNLKKLFNAIIKYNSHKDLCIIDTDFSALKFRLQKIKEIISSYWEIIDDKKLIHSYAEFILLMNKLEQIKQKEEEIIGESDMDIIKDAIYTITDCYQSLFSYNRKISNYVKKRNEKHGQICSLAVKEQINKESIPVHSEIK